MGMNDEWNTRKSLLKRAKDPSDEQAWDDFVAFYKNFIYHTLHRMGMNSADFDDLVQDILIKLWKKLKTYDDEKGQFRTWLYTVIRNAVYTYFDSIKRQRELLEIERHSAEALRSQSDSDLEKLIDEEWTKYLTSYAFDRVRSFFTGKAIEVFSLSLDGYSAEEIAKRMNLKRDTVYTLRNRVKARFIKEVHVLICEFEGEK